MHKKTSKLLLVTFLALSLLVTLTGCGGGQEDKADDSASNSNDPMDYQGELNVAAQNVNETVVLAHIAKVLIEENTGLTVNVNTDFTGSSVLHQAMVQDEIDVYPTWTGTQLTGVLGYEGPQMSSQETWDYVKEGFEDQFDMTWTKPFGFNNTYIMAAKEEVVQELDLQKSSDMAPYAKDWILAGDDNFDVRPDAYPGWSEAYGIEFKKVLPMQYSIIYRAIDKDEVDVIAAYATDPRIEELNLVTLEDDKGFFPDYSGAYVLRGSIAEKYPKLKEILEIISGEISNEQMSKLNYRHDIETVNPEDIAREFLEENDYI